MTYTAHEKESDEEQESWDAGEECRNWLIFEAEASPASAERFHIADLQHWIDLSA